MEKLICIPDSFQGTASSLEVFRIMSRKISEIYPDSEVIAIPAADGGEGSVAVIEMASCAGIPIPGAGVAGGMGAGMAIAWGAKLILTGEGRLDGESLCGKVVDGVAGRAKAPGIPSAAVVGGVGEGMNGIYVKGLTAVFPINQRPQDFSESRFYTEENIAFVVENILRLVRALEKQGGESCLSS